MEKIEKEQFFKHKNMSAWERDFYIALISSCKDISDSDNKINGIGKGELVTMNFEKNDRFVHANGAVTIGSAIQENRWIDAYIINDPQTTGTVVIMTVTRINYDGENKVYDVFDEFRYDGNSIMRKGFYVYGDKTLYHEASIQRWGEKVR